MSLLWDRTGREHRRLLAKLPRCKTCLLRVPIPTTTGECGYCFRRDEPRGTVLVPIKPAPAPDPLPLPVVDGEGGVAG